MRKYLIIMWLSVVATFNAAYLTYIALTNVSSFCDINASLSCSESLTATTTQIFGLPFPAIALGVYPVLFILAYLGYASQKSKMFKVLAVLSVGGILFNSYFIYQEYLLGAFCPLCLLCSAIIITIFGLSVSGWKK